MSEPSAPPAPASVPVPAVPRPVPYAAAGAVALGAFAVVLSVVPFVNVGALLAGLGALTLGLLVRHRTVGGDPGRRLATAGAVLGALAVAVSTIVLFAIGAIYTTRVSEGPAWEDAVVARGAGDG